MPKKKKPAKPLVNPQTLFEIAQSAKTFKKLLEATSADDALKALLKEQIENRNEKGCTPLINAIVNKNFPVIKFLIEILGADINCGIAKESRIGEWKVTHEIPLGAPLLCATSYNDTEIARYLIKQGAEVNVQGMGQMTPLLAAALANNLELVELLLSKNADIFATNHEGKTPLQLAITGVEPKEPAALLDVVERLLKANGNLLYQNKSGETALFLAAKYERNNVLSRLLIDTSTINTPDFYGWTPLLIAIKKRHEKTVELLLEAGANPNVAPPTKEGHFEDSAMKLALGIHSQAIAATLLRYGYKFKNETEHEVTRLQFPELQIAPPSATLDLVELFERATTDQTRLSVLMDVLKTVKTLNDTIRFDILKKAAQPLFEKEHIVPYLHQELKFQIMLDESSLIQVAPDGKTHIDALMRFWLTKTTLSLKEYDTLEALLPSPEIKIKSNTAPNWIQYISYINTLDLREKITEPWTIKARALVKTLLAKSIEQQNFTSLSIIQQFSNNCRSIFSIDDLSIIEEWINLFDNGLKKLKNKEVCQIEILRIANLFTQHLNAVNPEILKAAIASQQKQFFSLAELLMSFKNKTELDWGKEGEQNITEMVMEFLTLIHQLATPELLEEINSLAKQESRIEIEIAEEDSSTEESDEESEPCPSDTEKTSTATPSIESTILDDDSEPWQEVTKRAKKLPLAKRSSVRKPKPAKDPALSHWLANTLCIETDFNSVWLALDSLSKIKVDQTIGATLPHTLLQKASHKASQLPLIDFPGFAPFLLKIAYELKSQETLKEDASIRQELQMIADSLMSNLKFETSLWFYQPIILSLMMYAAALHTASIACEKNSALTWLFNLMSQENPIRNWILPTVVTNISRFIQHYATTFTPESGQWLTAQIRKTMEEPSLPALLYLVEGKEVVASSVHDKLFTLLFSIHKSQVEMRTTDSLDEYIATLLWTISRLKNEDTVEARVQNRQTLIPLTQHLFELQKIEVSPETRTHIEKAINLSRILPLLKTFKEHPDSIAEIRGLVKNYQTLCKS